MPTASCAGVGGVPSRSGILGYARVTVGPQFQMHRVSTESEVAPRPDGRRRASRQGGDAIRIDRDIAIEARGVLGGGAASA